MRHQLTHRELLFIASNRGVGDMKLIALDIETTGVSPLGGDRIVEIGAVEVVNGKTPSGEKCAFHHYINPERDIPDMVVHIHGIDNAKVEDKPTFKEIAQEFLDFINGAILVIHNAQFDLSFIMNELNLSGFPNIENAPAIDILAYAREKYPHQRNNLGALCDRYGIERGHRELHGALLDSELLAEVYLAITGEEKLSPGIDIPWHPASFFVQHTLAG
jgi:DNA polymerase-3 subunit epsilon